MKRTLLLLMAGVLTVSMLSCAGSQAFQRGERYAQRGEWDLAVKEYREAHKQDPHDIEYRSSLLRAEETAANQHYKRALSFLKERKLDQAITDLQQALFLNPSNAAIQSALKSVLDMKRAEDHYRASLTFMELGRLGEAINELNQAVGLDPENLKYHDSLDRLQKEKAEVEPDEALTLASDKPITLNFRNTNIKDVFEVLSKLSGINIMFDADVRAKPVTVFVKDVSFQFALNLLLSTNKLFMKKVSADTIIIIPKNKAKTNQYQDLMVKTFYLNIAKAKGIAKLLRTMLGIKKIHENKELNSLTIRDTPEKMKLVEKVIAANDLKEAEVILDVEILEIQRSNALKYGWHFSPGLSTTVTALSLNETGDPIATSSDGIALSEISNLSSKNLFLTLPSMVVDLIKQDSDAQILANPRVRVLNNKKAKFHVGDTIPFQTSSVQSTTAYASNTANYEYKDVGIKLTIEPSIHLNSTVTLKLSLEISNLGDAIDFGNGQKQFKVGKRKTETTINLRDGETVIIGGLIADEERKTRVKIPILGDIPILGKLFSSSDDGTIKTDILMSITPSIVRALEFPDKDSQAFWSGTADEFDVKPLFVTKTGKSSKPLDKTEILETLAKTDAASAEGKAVKPPTKPGQAARTVLELRPANASLRVGQEARFQLMAGGAKDLFGAIVTLRYDPKVVEFKTASEGMLLKKDNQQTSFLFSNNMKAGTVDIYMTRIGDVGGVDGNGNFCTLVFQAKSGGTSALSMKSVKLMDRNRKQLKADLKGATVVVK